LFVAIELDEEARRAIGVEQKRLQDMLSGRAGALRWTRPEHIHLTLAFLGDVAPDRSRSVVDALQRPLPGGRFRVTFGGLGVFPPHGSPRVVWLGLSHGAREVLAVQRHVATRVTELGIALEDRVFHPHLTLARWRRARPSDRRRVLAATRPQDVAGIDVEAVAIVESRLSSDGPAYRVLGRACLGGDLAVQTLESEG
jgi:2'-5' RNA ligase